MAEALNFFNTVRESRDGQSRHQQQQQQQQNKKEDETLDEVSPEKIEQAIHQFQSDAQAQANGLSVSTFGTGSGLKVVLKDVSGAVVRQFTGQEFLKLREAVSGDGQGRGKILDQKL